VRFFVAASRPTRSLLQKTRVVDVSDENVAGYFLLLKMAFQTKRGVAVVQQTLIHGAVRRMADTATLTHRLVLVHPWAALLCVTLKAGFVSAQESKTAGFKSLLNVCGRALKRDAFVRLMTIAAAHLSFGHRVMMRQLECRANFQVTLKTCFRRFSWVYNRATATTGLNVQTPRPVARLAAHVLGVFTFCL
jgi:hypothetical protein